MELLYLLAFLVIGCLGLVAFAIAILYIPIRLYELLFIFFDTRIRQRISQLKKSGFAPTHRFIRRGTGIAVDGVGKKVFLANGKIMKLYSIEQVSKVEADYKVDQYAIESALRVTVRDLESPFFEIKALLQPEKLRPIEGLLSVIREVKTDQSPTASPAEVKA